MISPNRTFVPYTGSIRLGSLLADPTKPDRPLTTLDLDELIQSRKYPEIEKVSESGVEVIRSIKTSISGAIWAGFVNTLSARISGERAQESRKQYTLEELRTEYFRFEPDVSVLQERVANKTVRGHMKKSLFRSTPVYMIDGIKIATGLRVVNEVSEEKSNSAAASGSITTPAGDVNAGLDAKAESSASQQDKSDLSQDVVISYRLLKLWYPMWSADLEKEEFDPGAAGFQSIEDEESDSTREEGSETLVASAAVSSDIGALGREISITDVVLDDGTILSLVAFSQI